ncbi:hypothetical protein [Tenacibaculum sp. IB213877]|uniref:hypothetical protein n=1 Tax=Tenacibaculum sp. IB213877 TaxID=3097351 RepID=UPI002A5A86B5|nr:hypothetical protein [Tenacibaculum sp. IB213877]MDY0781290.1 hypothetical protein [Tenacibaculum sp. IB213877]
MGINNFAKLPVLTKNVMDVSVIDKQHQFNRKISIVTFLGNDIEASKGEIFNLNQKIYKPFYGFKDFQMIVFAPKGTEEQVEKLKKEIGNFTPMEKWNFIIADKAEITFLYESFNTNESLDANLHISKAFIIDKELNLRGRKNDKDMADGMLYGYDMQSVAELNNKMKDDVKVVLAEYRLALKKNNADREI